MLFFVANVTPFDARGKLDLGQLRAHILGLAARGVEGFVPTGSTGEFLYLTDREREAVHRTVLDAARGMPVYPCVWDPSLTTMAYLCEAARDNGASGVMVPPPLYYRVEEPVLADWYRSFADAAQLPVLAYHNPTYFPTPISESLYLQLRKEGVLAGMKDSAEDLWRLKRLAAADPGGVFAGGAGVLPDVHTVPQLAGYISALGNAWPSLCLRSFRGEVQLRDALAERAAKVRAAGGFRALKATLGMGCRAPFVTPSAEKMEGIPPAEAAAR
ncbi:MAG: dihydrodipicolinate synthase family protein [Deltaproteobacteria bacterium]|nr:dihydrodipicolinate synthase family protein [Deltaproteobacteria bacterium]